jgi:DNA-binding SARP family transcriptional activator
MEGAALDVRLLGPIAAERDGEAVALGGPRQRAVLARLALVAGQVVTVDRLVDDVWAGDPPATAVNTLQSYVSLLRRALGDRQHLRREGPGYVLSVGRGELDAARFEDRVAKGRARLAGNPAEALELFDAALAEWRGPPLADVADEDWARSAAVRWEELRLDALEARFDALLALGRHVEAVSALERATAEHPLREGLARRLMIALYRSGRQADALRAYGRTRELLADELGLDPTPELAELQTAILNHDPELAAPTVAPPPPPSPTAPAAAPPTEVPATNGRNGTVVAEPTPSASPVPLPGPALRAGASQFVGRERHLDLLHRIWRTTLTGQSHLALLSGEAGAGKSRLAAQFAADVHGLGGIVLWGRATAEAIVPFEPIVEAMRTVLRTVSSDARRRVAAERGHLGLLLPEIDQLVPEARAEPVDPSVERYVLFETVAELLRSESAQHPLLFVVDDIGWADAPSLKMIDHVLRHELPGRVMAIGTLRSPDDVPHPELDRVAADLARDGLLTRLALDGLRAVDVEELLRANGRDDAEAEELRAATGGNAFFLTELIHHGNEGSLGDDLPESILAMVGGRLDRLDPIVTRVLNLAAVAGPAATLPVLVAASDLDGDRLLDATDTALAAGLLIEDGAGRLGMPHALIRQAILARLGRTRRLDLHRRIADALQQDQEPQSSPATLAHHLIEAGSLADRQQRIDAGLAAGRHAVDIGAFEDAASWTDRVAELFTDRAGVHDRAHLALLQCDVARSRGDRARAVDAARRAAGFARASGDPELLSRAAQGWMTSLSAVGFDIGLPPDPELVVLLEAAIASLTSPETRRYQVRLRSMLASVLVATRDWDRRKRLADEALSIARADGRPELLASAQLARRLALWRVDQLEERTAAGLEAVAAARRTDNMHLELTAVLFVLTDLLELGRFDEHLQLFAEFRARMSGTPQPLYDVYAKFLEAGHRVAAGDYPDAKRLADEALAAGTAAHGVNAEIAYAGLTYRMAQDTGTLGTMAPHAERMVTLNPRLRLWQVALVGALLAAGRMDDARAVFEGMVGTDRVHLRDNQMFLPAACFLAEAAHALDDRQRAQVLRQALEPYVGRVAVSGLGGVAIGPVSCYVGLMAFMNGDLDDAERHLRAAIEQNVRMGTRPHEARARRDLSWVLAARGDADGAAAEAARAAQIAAEIGMVLGDTL